MVILASKSLAWGFFSSLANHQILECSWVFVISPNLSWTWIKKKSFQVETDTPSPGSMLIVWRLGSLSHASGKNLFSCCIQELEYKQASFHKRQCGLVKRALNWRDVNSNSCSAMNLTRWPWANDFGSELLCRAVVRGKSASRKKRVMEIILGKANMPKCETVFTALEVPSS